METKKLIHSRVFWLAVAQGVVGVITAFATNYPSVGCLVIAKSFADILLRTFTVKAIQ